MVCVCVCLDAHSINESRSLIRPLPHIVFSPPSDQGPTYNCRCAVPLTRDSCSAAGPLDARTYAADSARWGRGLDSVGVLGRPAARIAAADTDVHFLCVGMTEWRRHCRVAAASSAHHRTYRLFTDDDDDDDDCPPNYTTAQHALPLWRSASREHFNLDTFFLSFFLSSIFFFDPLRRSVSREHFA